MKIPFVKPILRLALLIVSIVIYLVTILSAYGGRFDTEFFTLPAMLTLALPYLAILTALITIAWFACGKIFGGVLGVLTIIASWGPISTAFPFSTPKVPTSGRDGFTLMTFNMIHGEDMEKKDSTANRTIRYIINSGADIVCLQELLRLDNTEIPDMTDAQLAELNKVYPYQANDTKNDLAVLSKYPVSLEKASDYITGDYDQKRYSFFKANVDGKPLTIVNMHLRSYFMTPEDCDTLTSIKSVGEAKRSFRLLRGPFRRKLARGFSKRKADAQILREALDKIEGPLIVCGDFNDVPESYAYRLLRGDDLNDAYVETCFGPLITYNAHMFWFHLDQVFYRGPLKALDVRKGRTKVSDHYPLIADFEFTDNNKSSK